MGRSTSKKNIGLGKALINDKYKSATKGPNPSNSSRHTTQSDSYGSNATLRSVTQERALDEFLSTAALADTDFTAERANVKIIANDQFNPYLLTPEQESLKRRKHADFRQSLTVPRRPPWNSETTPTQLERNEKEAFLEWRRHLAQLQEEHDLLLTPFERNLEVWRQLWRVVERSDLIVQIVDGRDPLLFRCTDLEKYVKQISDRKRNLLLVNKSDLLTVDQRKAWAQYFVRNKIQYRFFSASLAKSENEQLESSLSAKAENEQLESSLSEICLNTAENTSGVVNMQDQDIAVMHRNNIQADDENCSLNQATDDGDIVLHTDILTIGELEELFLSEAPAPLKGDNGKPGKVLVGLVGYPNVGKSSTINAMVGAKTVSVSATPGKTKHFQTIQLSDRITLVDCPGLVFPNFASTQADLVCAGVLPIDQLREFTGPAALVAKRIPQNYLEAIYGITIHVRSSEQGGSGTPTAEELLVAYALSRGFTKASQGNPDESRAARYILKDYVSGKLLFAQAPPSWPEKENFNAQLQESNAVSSKKKAPSTHVPSTASTFVSNETNDASTGLASQYSASGQVDRSFFKPARVVHAGVKGSQSFAARGPSGTINGKVIMYPYQQRLADDGSLESANGKMLTGRKARAQAALDQGVSPEDMTNSKKHYKGMTKQKSRPAMY